MHAMPPDEINPYAAPSAPLGDAPTLTGGPLAEVEAIRRKYLSHEASVKAIGALNFAGAVVLAFAAVALIVGMYFVGPDAIKVGPVAFMPRVILGVLAVVYLAMAVLSGTLGIGLRNLRPWSRWGTAGLTAFSILVNLGSLSSTALRGKPEDLAPSVAGTFIGVAIGLYILNLVIGKKAPYVFSPAYQEVIAQTPHIKYKSSCILKGALVFFLVLVLLIVIGAIVGNSTRVGR
jgi:hypothetical protein